MFRRERDQLHTQMGRFWKFSGGAEGTLFSGGGFVIIGFGSPVINSEEGFAMHFWELF